MKDKFKETIELLKQFKWYIMLYSFNLFITIDELFFTTHQEDDGIWKSEAMRDAWNYVSKDVYVNSLRLFLINELLLLWVALLYMRSHPRFAKFLFLYPYIYGLISNMVELVQDLF